MASIDIDALSPAILLNNSEGLSYLHFSRDRLRDSRVVYRLMIYLKKFNKCPAICLSIIDLTIIMTLI